MDRTCDGCTKCCDGWLSGIAHGRAFWSGRPCHFVGQNGCTIYNDRPQDPCKSYQCEWLVNDDVPEWLKPSMSNVLISKRKSGDTEYWRVSEAGAKITVEALSWVFMHCLSKNVNFIYNIGDGHYRFGSKEFLSAKLES